MFLGLRTIIYPAPDLAASKAWFTDLLGAEPYFDQTFYVGFDVGGYELGLQPDVSPDEGPTTYWGVENVDTALAEVISRGATLRKPVQDVGEKIRVATVTTPDGFLLGLIENPHFEPRNS